MDTASPTRFDSLPRGLAVVSALAGAMLALVLAGAAIPAVGEGNLEGPGADGPGAEEPGRQATSTRDHGGETLPAASAGNSTQTSSGTAAGSVSPP